MNGPTTRPAILRRARQPGFEDQLRISGRLFDHLPGDAAQWNLDSALPAGVGLSGQFSDVDVDESTRRRPLRQRAEKVRQVIVTIVLHRHHAIEAEITTIRSLLLDRLVVIAFAVLKAGEHPPRDEAQV